VGAYVGTQVFGFPGGTVGGFLAGFCAEGVLSYSFDNGAPYNGSVEFILPQPGYYQGAPGACLHWE